MDLNHGQLAIRTSTKQDVLFEVQLHATHRIRVNLQFLSLFEIREHVQANGARLAQFIHSPEESTWLFAL